MTTVLVTGGCGFFGTNVVLDRLRRGDNVRVLDNYARLGPEHTRGEPGLLSDSRGERDCSTWTTDLEATYETGAQRIDAVFGTASDIGRARPAPFRWSNASSSSSRNSATASRSLTTSGGPATSGFTSGDVHAAAPDLGWQPRTPIAARMDPLPSVAERTHDGGGMSAICVTGIWHQGAVVAACLADLGHEVVGLSDPVAASRLRGGPASRPRARATRALAGRDRLPAASLHLGHR